jgi:hypothetical protein
MAKMDLGKSNKSSQIAFHSVTWVCCELLPNLVLLRRQKIAVTNIPAILKVMKAMAIPYCNSCLTTFPPDLVSEWQSPHTCKFLKIWKGFAGVVPMNPNVLATLSL